MSDEKIDYEAVLADLVTKRDALNAAIVAIEQMTGHPAGPGTGGGDGGKKVAPTTVESDTFFGMKAPEAARKYLAIAKKPQSVKDIADALDRGGITHQSSNFVNTMYTTLKREDDRGGEIVKVGKNWGLAAWYPGRARRKKAGAEEVADEAEETTETEAATKAVSKAVS